MKTKFKYLISVSLLFIFIIFTFLVKLVDVKAIGPNGSFVGFATLNKAFHDFTGVNYTMYKLTDYGSIPAFLLVGVYALIGLVELIKNKDIKKVEPQILALGIFYVMIFDYYIIFELVKINFRPVLIEGKLETSYPSSTTLLSLAVILTSIDQTNRYLKNKYLKYSAFAISLIYGLFLVVGRIISGVHWLSDIIGSIILASSSVIFYYALKDSLCSKLVKKEDNN